MSIQPYRKGETRRRPSCTSAHLSPAGGAYCRRDPGRTPLTSVVIADGEMPLCRISEASLTCPIIADAKVAAGAGVETTR